MANKSRLNNYTGYNGLYKGIVTRAYTDDPLAKGRLQVWIPFYHGGSKPDSSMIGSGNDPGRYPWAQVSSIRFGASGNTGASPGGSSGGFFDIIKSLLGLGSTEYSGGSTFSGNVKVADIVYPNVGDPVWLQFENGDIRYPIYVGSLVNGNETITMSLSSFDIAEKTADMIKANESGGSYKSINWSDGNKLTDGGISIGLIQWHNSRARELMMEIRDINKDGFDTVCKDNNCTDFNTILDNQRRWTPARFNENSIYGKVIKALLETDNSVTAQDLKIVKDVQSYIDKAKSKGYNDIGAIMLCADYMNKCGHLPKININPAAATLDTTLNAILNISNIQRWKNDYNFIMSLVNSGVLIKDSSRRITISYIPGEDNEPMFTFPVPKCQSVTRNFSSGTNGIKSIDISDGTMSTSGLDVIAAHDGTATFGYDSKRGNYVEIEYHKPTKTSSAVANIALQEWDKANNPTKHLWNYKLNGTKYSPKGSAWCAYFSTWCCVQAGIMTKQIGGVQNTEKHFKDKGMFGTYPNYRPVVGDLLTMRYNGGNHIGVIVEINGDTITVVDGNTRSGASPRPPKGTSGIAKTKFSYSSGRSTGGGFYRTVGYCKTGTAAGAASQYDSVITGYYHLGNKIATNGKKLEVKAGQKIGTIGQTGKCSGPLLEFSMKINGSYIDPMSKMSTVTSSNRGALIGNYRVTAYYPDSSSMEGGYLDMKDRKLNPATLDTIAVTKSLLQSYGGPLKYGDKVIIEGISRYVSGKKDDVCIVRDTGDGLKGIDFLVANKSQERSWKNPNLNVYYCK